MERQGPLSNNFIRYIAVLGLCIIFIGAGASLSAPQAEASQTWQEAESWENTYSTSHEFQTVESWNTNFEGEMVEDWQYVETWQNVFEGPVEDWLSVESWNTNFEDIEDWQYVESYNLSWSDPFTPDPPPDPTDAIDMEEIINVVIIFLSLMMPAILLGSGLGKAGFFLGYIIGILMLWLMFTVPLGVLMLFIGTIPLLASDLDVDRSNLGGGLR